MGEPGLARDDEGERDYPARLRAILPALAQRSGSASPTTGRGAAELERSAPAPVSSIAAPVRDRLGATVAAVPVVVPRGAARPAAYEQVVRASVLGIERGLGWPSPHLAGCGLA